MPDATQRTILGIVLALGASTGMAACGGGTPRTPTLEEEVVAAGGASDPDEATPENFVPDESADDVGSSPGAADGESRLTVGGNGGTLQLRSGAELRIPAGALTGNVEVILGLGAQSAVLATNENRAVGPILRVEPALAAANGTTFEISAPFASVPSGYSEEDLALAVETPGTQRALDIGGVQTRWENFPAKRVGNRLVAQVANLPGLRVAFVVTH